MRALISAVFCLFFALTLHAQQIVAAEYFFDHDPGLGQGTAIAVAAGDSITNNIQISTSSLNPGRHRLYIRVKDASGQWTHYLSRIFLVEAPAPPVFGFEYFIDQYPGHGNGVQLSGIPGDSITTNAIIPTAGLAPGRHRLYVMARTADGGYTHHMTKPFLVNLPEPQVETFEYYIDQYPGHGNGVPIATTPGDSAKETTVIPTAGLEPGRHRLYVKARTADGEYTHHLTRYFLIDPPTDDVVAFEYFVDSYPGYGNGTPIASTPGDSIAASITVPTAGLSIGRHRLYVMAKNSSGEYTHHLSRPFLVEPDPSKREISVMEVFLNAEPGVGQGTPISIGSPPVDSVNGTFQYNTASVPIGNHELYWRVKEEGGIWSHYMRRQFSVFPCGINQLADYQILDTPVCPGGSVRLRNSGSYALADSLISFQWDLDGDGVVDTIGPDSLVLAGLSAGSRDITMWIIDTADPRCRDSVTYPLVVHPTYFNTKHDTICDGDSVLIFGSYRHTAGSYLDTQTSIFGCDSICQVDLVVSPIIMTSSTAHICDGDSVFVAGAWRKSAGQYTDTGTALNGCDSIHTTTVQIHPNYAVHRMDTICDGDSILIGGSWQHMGGVYFDTQQSAYGCDSIIEVGLVIDPGSSGAENRDICEGDSTQISGQWQSQPGVYYDTLVGANGCDSVVEVTLGFLPVDSCVEAFQSLTGSKVIVYPVPLKSTMVLRLHGEWTDALQIGMINAMGAEVFATRLTAYRNDDVVIPLPKMAAGHYVVRVQSGNAIASTVVSVAGD